MATTAGLAGSESDRRAATGGREKAPVIARSCSPSRTASSLRRKNYRAVTIPWIKARATGAPAGLLACGSLLDARLPGSPCSFIQWPALRVRKGTVCISLSAHSCRDSRGFGKERPSRTAFPI